jgi:hypothetical protein
MIIKLLYIRLIIINYIYHDDGENNIIIELKFIINIKTTNTHTHIHSFSSSATHTATK